MRNRDTRGDMARNLGKRGGQVRRYIYGCVTMACEMYVETLLEMKVARLLDIDPRVNAIYAQPFCLNLESKVVYPTQAEAASSLGPPEQREPSAEDALLYTPDFLIGLTGSMPLLIEVKSTSELVHIAAEMKHKRHAANAAGYRLIVITDEHAGHKGLESNLAPLRDAMKALRRQGMTAELRQLQEAVESLEGSCPLGQLASRFPVHVLQLGVAAGVLGCDLRHGMIGRGTLVWAAYGDLSHLQLLNFDEHDDLIANVAAPASKAHVPAGDRESGRQATTQAARFARDSNQGASPCLK